MWSAPGDLTLSWPLWPTLCPLWLWLDLVRRLWLTLLSRLFSLGLSSLLRECSFDHSQASLGLLEFKLYGLGLWVMSVYSAGTALMNELLVVDLVIMLVGPRCASPVDLFACV